VGIADRWVLSGGHDCQASKGDDRSGAARAHGSWYRIVWPAAVVTGQGASEAGRRRHGGRGHRPRA
jgi:hypothetical protein